MINRFAVLCLVATAFSGTARAQQACMLRLRLRLLEAHSGLPVHPATLYVDNGSRGYEADESGNILADSLCAGAHTWFVQTDGYGTDTGTVALGRDTLLIRRMAHLAQSLQQITVQDERVRTILQSKSTLEKAALDEGSGKTLGQLLQQVNGVNVFANGGTIAKPVIHGLRSNRILTLNNGIRQEDQQWGDEHAPNIDPFLASNITVIKGAAGVRYGTDAMGGVILVEPATLRAAPGWGGEVNLAAFSNNRMGVAEAMVEHAFAKIPGLAFRLQGTLKRGGNYRIPGYWAANTGVAETNYSATLGYRRAHQSFELFYSHFDTELGLYRGSHTGSREDLLNAINSDTPRVSAEFTYKIDRPRQHVVHDLIKLKAATDTRIGRLGLTYAFQHNFRQEYDVVRVDNGKAQLNLTLNTQTLNLNLDLKTMRGFTGQAGIDGIYQSNFFRDGDRLFIPGYTSLGGGGYLIERWKKNAWAVEGGLRFDYRHFNVTNHEGNNQRPVQYAYSYNSLSGTLGGSRHVSKHLGLTATASTAWRAPQANELFSAGLHQGAARIELGDKALNPERSYGLNVEAKWTKNRLSGELALYTQYIKDYIYLRPGPDLLTIQGYYKTFNYRQTDAWLNGADISAAYQWNSALQTNLKGSFLLARNTVAKDWLILMPPDRLSLGTRYTRTLSTRFKDCYVELNDRYVFRQSRIPANFDSVDYPRPPAAYFLLDASIGTTVMAGRQPVKISVSIDNALNMRYREYLDAFRYFIDQPGRNVVVRVNVPF